MVARVKRPHKKVDNGRPKIVISYDPLPKQKLFHETPANEVLFGGAAGPGKSRALRMDLLNWCLRIPNLQAYLFRRHHSELDKNHVIPSLTEFPRDCGVYRGSPFFRWEFRNGSMLHFCHCQHIKDRFKYHGAEIHILGMDELTDFEEDIYTFLFARTRCPMPIPEAYRHKIPGAYCASNPGGIGHGWVKERWVDKCPKIEDLYRPTFSELGLPADFPKEDVHILRAYIPARMDDNPHLMKNDPGYKLRVMGMPEPLRSAWLNGDWDIYLGQAFRFSYRQHVLSEDLPVPKHGPLYMTFDFGHSRPFSVGWWWVDGDERLYRFREWYGASTNPPNTGLRLTDSEIARGIIERERDWGLEGIPIIRLAGHDCFNRRPDFYTGQGMGPSTADIFAENGLFLQPGDADRKQKIRQFRERIKTYEDGTRPMLMVYPGSEAFIRTIPLLQTDQRNPEDIDSNGEDHVYDEACHVCMARPVAAPDPVNALGPSARRWNRALGIVDYDDPHDNMAAKERLLGLDDGNAFM